MYTKKVNLSELITVRTESEIEGNFTSVRGEYYVPSINKTGFYKESGCMLDANGDEHLRESLASDILKMLGMPCADVIMIYDDINNKNGCLSVNILNSNENFISSETGYFGSYTSPKPVYNINDYIENDLAQYSKLPNITKEILDERRKFLIKYLFASAVISNTDIKNDNCQLIYNSENGEYRNPEYYDAGVAFLEGENRKFFGKQTSKEVLQELYNSFPKEISELAQNVQKKLSNRNIEKIMNNILYSDFSKEVSNEIKQNLLDNANFVKTQNRKIKKAEIGIEITQIRQKIADLLYKIKNIFSGKEVKMLTDGNEDYKQQEDLHKKFMLEYGQNTFESQMKQRYTQQNEQQSTRDVEEKNIEDSEIDDR